jgi:nitrate/nitrite-specific signal transduction histidine kinase
MYRTSTSHADRQAASSIAESTRTRNSLPFAAQSRARLDLSLDVVVVAAQRVLTTQTRLRELLAANQTIARYRDRSALLGGIIHSAVALVEAGSGVFDVYETPGRAGSLVHCGSDARRPTEARTTERRVQLDGEVFGTLYLGRDGPNEFSAEDEQLLSSFTEMAAIAIWNANNREKTAPLDAE